MKECVIRLDGNVIDILNFMIDNFKFIEMGKRGLEFTSIINFGASVNEMDNDAMRQIYGTDAMGICRELKVNINKHYGEEYDEDTDSYYEVEPDDRPYDLYSFTIKNYGDYNILTKEFINGQYFKPHTSVFDKIEFMNDFFKAFSNLQFKDHKKLNDLGHLSIKTLVHDDPIELIKKWNERYNLGISMTYINGEKGEILDYYLNKNLVPENIKPRIIDVDKNAQDYITILLRHELADIGLICDNICDMLYNMKDKLPFDLSDLVYDENNNYIKYCRTRSNVTGLVGSLAHKDPHQLSRIYVMLCNTHNKLVESDKQMSYNIYNSRFSNDNF